MSVAKQHRAPSEAFSQQRRRGLFRRGEPYRGQSFVYYPPVTRITIGRVTLHCCRSSKLRCYGYEGRRNERRHRCGLYVSAVHMNMHARSIGCTSHQVERLVSCSVPRLTLRYLNLAKQTISLMRSRHGETPMQFRCKPLVVEASRHLFVQYGTYCQMECIGVDLAQSDCVPHTRHTTEPRRTYGLKPLSDAPPPLPRSRTRILPHSAKERRVLLRHPHRRRPVQRLKPSPSDAREIWGISPAVSDKTVRPVR